MQYEDQMQQARGQGKTALGPTTSLGSIDECPGQRRQKKREIKPEISRAETIDVPPDAKQKSGISYSNIGRKMARSLKRMKREQSQEVCFPCLKTPSHTSLSVIIHITSRFLFLTTYFKALLCNFLCMSHQFFLLHFVNKHD